MASGTGRVPAPPRSSANRSASGDGADGRGGTRARGRDAVRCKQSAYQRSQAATARERNTEHLKAARVAPVEIKRQRQVREDKAQQGQEAEKAARLQHRLRARRHEDGGRRFPPRTHVQVASVAGEQIVTGFDVTNNGSDRRLMRPCWSGSAPALEACSKTILSMAALATPTTSSGRSIRDRHALSAHTQSGSSLPRARDGSGVLAW